MRMIKILQAVAVVAVIGLFASCGSGREYQENPRSRYSYNSQSSLILTPRQGFTMSRNPDGRYYHRSRQGLVYWQGQDNRFYLDKAQLRKVRYSNREYREWKKYGKRYSKRGRY